MTMSTRHVIRWLLCVVTGVGVGVIGGPAAVAVEREVPPSAVDRFEYPGADRIFAETGVRLHRGDGHILYTECVPEEDQLRVMVLEPAMTVCFRVRGEVGFLTLEVPEVYGIMGGSAEVVATVEMDGQRQSVTVPSNDWVSVGEGDNDPETGSAVLIELRVSV